MNAEVKARWVEALRGGRYKQGKTSLRRKDESFCCLGVLCDLHDPAGWVPGPNRENYGYRATEATGFPPLVVCNAAGLPPDQAGDLAVMNDFGKSFDEIASVIEERY